MARGNFSAAGEVRQVKIGLISDTHGLVRPEALRELRRADRLIHAGDVGSPDVVEALRGLAPITLIRGNVDRDRWGRSLLDTQTVDLEGNRVHVLHAIQDLVVDPAEEGIDVVVAGHSHQPKVERRNGVLYVNPGSAGPRRFRLPVTVGWLHLSRKRSPRARIVELL